MMLIFKYGHCMNNMIKLRKFVSPEIIFGNGARSLAGKYASQFGAKKVMIVTDPGVTLAGWLTEIVKSVEEAGIAYTIFSQISPNPRAEEVMLGAALYQEEECDVIIAIGGGSPMDCAKGIGIISANGGNILNYEGVDKIFTPVPPLIFIPTTAGSSADVSQFCIISNRQELVKIAIVSKAIVPDVALIDPETTLTMDNYLTACTGIDALVHAVEAYVSTGSGPLTDSYALEAIRLITNHLPQLIREPQRADLREKIMLGSMKAGLAFSNAILGAVHAMAHSLGGFLDLAHGECNALLLEHVVNFNYNITPDRYKDISEAFGLSTGGLTNKEIQTNLVNTIINLKKEVGIVEKLASRGVKLTDIPALSQKAIKDACMLTNPRKATVEDIKVIYKEAL